MFSHSDKTSVPGSCPGGDLGQAESSTIAGRAGSLGNNAKSPSLGGSEYDSGVAKIGRFVTQAAARFCLPESRTAKCLRIRRLQNEGHSAAVSVWRAVEHATAHYKGLQTCGSVWACPVCSGTISERRRVELAQAIAMHRAAGGVVLLLTLTNRHERRDDLGELVKGQAEALRRFMRGTKAAKSWFAALGSIGTIRAMEVTHGDANGWHPHYHVLVFARAGVDLSEMSRQGAAIWANCCKLAGLRIPSIERGLTLQGGDYAAKYVGKWGLEQEMTKGHQKKALAGGATPFDLLRRIVAGDRVSRSAALFREFAGVFKGRRQLVWSKGLKARFAVEDASDEAIAEGGDIEGSELFARISLVEWRAVLRADDHGAKGIRGQLLVLAGRNDRLGFSMLLQGAVQCSARAHAGREFFFREWGRPKGERVNT